MKSILVFCCLATACLLAHGQDQKVVGDCTVTFGITAGDAAQNNNLAGAIKTFYIKGKLSRVDITNSDYQQSVICNNTTGDAVVLQQVGANKYLTRLTAEKWKQKNSVYVDAKFTFLPGETKNILGYECKKGTAALAGGGTFTFYYATTIIPSVPENAYQFKNIPGFVLEYEIADKGKPAIMYTATKIDFSPVPDSKFDIPTSGYLVRE